MSRRPTSRDVARLAGVAQSTVSYVLTGKGSISPETRERVRRAAEAIRYRPNLAARSMRTRRTGRLAVVMGIPIFNPVRMLAGASAVADAAGYALEVHSIVGTAEVRSARMVELVESGQIEGILALTPVLPTSELLEPDGVVIITSANFDDEMHSIGELADGSLVEAFIERLAEMGHQRFLHVGGSMQFASARARRDSYLATIKRLGLESVGVLGGDWTGEAGIDAIRSLPDDSPPLAVIAANDIIAVGVMRGAAERGWSVPGDISVTGWDNYDVDPFLSPSLTSVAVDLEEAGRRAMQRLIAVLRGEQPPTPGTLNRIVWRESTAPPRTP